MLEKLIGGALTAKATALPAVLILAGALVTTSAETAATTFEEQPSPTPAISAPVEPTRTPKPEPTRQPEETNAPKTDPTACDSEAAARSEARERVREAYAKYHLALEHLRTERPGAKAAETIARADAMIKQIAEYADRIIAQIGDCPEAEVVTSSTLPLAAISTHFDGDARTMLQVAERAIAAMETVYNLARTAAFETPKPTVKPTEKPKQTEKPKVTPKPAKTPGCEDRLYAAKKVMMEAFDRFHGANDQMYYAIKPWASDRALNAVKAADQEIHRVFDSTKDAILRSNCSENTALELARRAADAFERAHNAAKAIVSAEYAARFGKPTATPTAAHP